MPVGVQLYTLRDLAERDLAGAFGAVSEAGYKWIELYGDGFGHSVEKVVDMLDAADLKVAATHVGLDRLETELPTVIDECRALETELRRRGKL